MMKRALFFWALTVAAAPILIAVEAPTEDPRWAQAQQAYEANHDDEGHSLLAGLAADHPGDLDLAVRCYTTILREEGRPGTTNLWSKLAAERLMSLEHLGAISANTPAIREAASNVIEARLKKGRHLEVREIVDRLHEQNQHDLHWRMRQAYNYRRMDLAEARPLYQALKDESDPDHPDLSTREQWALMAPELGMIESLAKPIFPLPKGSPLLIMEPDDPDGHWRTVLDNSPSKIPQEIDRLAAHAFVGDQIVLWQDLSGLIDPPRALDLHLRSKPAPELNPLRRAQAENFEREILPTNPSEGEILALSRRFAWSLNAQKLLLDVGNTALWDGRTESALRSFEELLAHTIDPALKDAAQVGYWTALKLSGGIEELRASADSIDPSKDYPWMGQSAKGAHIRAELLKGTTPPPAITAPSITTATQHVLQLPPVSPWPSDTPAVGFGIDLQIADSQVIVSGRNMLVSYDANDPQQPLWSQLHRHPIEQHRKTGYHPGYFRPLIRDGKLYTRWGLTSLPNGIAAFDLTAGRPLWSHQYTRGNSPYSSGVPMGDPVHADGMLFYLQWNTHGDVTDRRRTITLVSFDPRKGKPRWTATIASAGKSIDFLAKLERAAPQSAIYGNPVTVHRGAVYCNSNAGMIARCDVRDGRVDWIHYYRRTQSNFAPENLGSAPLIAGDTVICMPRDAGRIFALDQRTGRLLWDNPMVLATEALGIYENTLVVRGVGVLAGLDLKTGQARWFRPLTGRVLGRAQLIGDSIYLGEVDELRRLEVPTGKLLEKRPWNLGEARPLGFRISGDHLYVVSDNPAADRRQKIGQPLAEVTGEHSPLTLPLKRTWTLSRGDAQIALAPPDSGIRDTAYLLSGGILECLDLSPGGAIRWRRFIDAHNATLSFHADKLLLVERNRSPHTSCRAVALSAHDGKFLWEAPVPASLGNPYYFGSRLLYHDRRGKMVALDLETGRQAWERNLSEAHFVEPYWDGEKLHVFHASLWHGPRHLTLDPATGRTIQRQPVVTHADKSTAHGRQIENGWYEVRFPPTSARFVKFTTLSDIGGRGWASAAEIQFLDANGQRINREGWKVDGAHDLKSARRPVPAKLIDGDPESWWHTQWLGGIPQHPHDLFFDLGASQIVTGLQYLPAKIVNNNGMIRDYELHSRQDEQEDWGDATAKGILVNRLRVERAHFGPKALFFESRNYPQNDHAVFRYGFEGNPSQRVEERARLLSMHGRYALISGRNDKDKEILILRRSDDPDYRFDLSPRIEHGRHADIVIEGDRLIMGRHKIVIADLNSRQFIDIPEDKKSLRNHPGVFVRLGKDHFLKIVHHNNRQALSMVNMISGQITEGVLETQIEPFKENQFLRPAGQRLLTFDRTLLFYDNSTLSGWVTAP